VDASQPVGIYNTVEGDYMVYCARPLAINLRWLKDQEAKGCKGLFGTIVAEGEKAADVVR
jgi:hypothetical protein